MYEFARLLLPQKVYEVDSFYPLMTAHRTSASLRGEGAQDRISMGYYLPFLFETAACHTLCKQGF